MVGCCNPFRAAVGLGVVGLACLAFGVFLIVMVPAIVKDQVAKNVRLSPKGMVFKLWKDIPVPLFMSLYIFEVLNSKEVLRGATPAVAQRGPYVYREQREKTNITFHNNGTVSFLEYRYFNFQPDLSNGSESDYVIVPNILVMGAAVMFEHLPMPMRLTLSSAFVVFGQGAFMNRTVGEIMWGYEDPLIDFLNSLKPGLLPFKGKFGLLSELNNSHSGLFTVNTGMENISKIHMVDTWNGLKKVPYWNSDQCNMINGTIGQLWPPFLTSSSPIELYSPDACRSMRFTYNKSGEFKGIPTFRFLAPKTLFANGIDYPPNEGFCPCRQSGILNVSSCRFNAPLFISHPHFLNADPELLKTVDGLHPNEEEHGLFVDLHPLTGIPMNFSIKMQLSLFMKKVPGILQTGTVKPVVLPLLWFAESGEIQGDVLTMFYTILLIPVILGYAQYFLVALGGVLLLIAALLMLKNKTLKDGPISIQTPSTITFFNPGSGTDYKYQGPQRDAQVKTPLMSNLPNGQLEDSDTAPLLQKDLSTVHPRVVSYT
ncbi:scavenger receptor class B member 1 isoform X3 [Rhineura floridana]|uniref:scavenger receptor class B member 1 isoform X3 n=1 Tax=Rhineura floridana TaxID=261503 RepID=UPI002AC7E9C3|nr:scavenger receptor class B member 1 isoform X3 [Rhineura floridana]